MNSLDTLELCRGRSEVVRGASLHQKQTLVVPVAGVTSRASRVRVRRRARDTGEVRVWNRDVGAGWTADAVKPVGLDEEGLARIELIRFDLEFGRGESDARAEDDDRKGRQERAKLHVSSFATGSEPRAASACLSCQKALTLSVGKR